jgi:tRNA (guanine-N7-)-methyltransferase
MTHPTFLAKYAAVLKPAGDLLIKHDNRSFFTWTLEQLVGQGWRILELSFDLHESDVLDEYKILTAYERRWLAEGLTTQFVRARIA